MGSKKVWQYAKVDLVKGTQGGLYLSYFDSKSDTLQHMIHTDSSTPLEMLLAQLGERGWRVIDMEMGSHFLLSRKAEKGMKIHEPALEGIHFDPEVKPTKDSRDKDEEKPKTHHPDKEEAYDAKIKAAHFGIDISDDTD